MEFINSNVWAGNKFSVAGKLFPSTRNPSSITRYPSVSSSSSNGDNNVYESLDDYSQEQAEEQAEERRQEQVQGQMQILNEHVEQNPPRYRYASYE